MHSAAQPLARLDDAIACWNRDDIDGYLRLYAPHVVLHGYAGVEPGIDGVRAFYAGFREAFAPSRITVEDAFAAGDRVACRFVLRARHAGAFQGLAATGRDVVLPGITLLRFDDAGHCVERWSQADFLGLLAQLGALPGG